MIPLPSPWTYVPAALAVGLVFSPLAAAMAFLITYQEYRRHFPDRAPAVRHAVQMALATLALFLALTVGAAVLIGLFPS